ncbi:S41 family peptidase [Ferviditalea candida]|uniref:S41 family peptidase n=1 Tax=Ferviditalea candida TaxID=3108399 RepID=A0ABU5ZJP1_9BACL|nr:S41 family peptidase [Paenibacillaceae bacterium T2]
MKNRKQKYVTSGLLAVMLLMLPLATALAAAEVEPSQQTADQVRELILKYHVSAPAENKIPKTNINEMIKDLSDPYTQYFSPEDWQSFQNQIENHYVGIGIRLGQDEKGFYAVEVFPGSPAEKAAMKPGDYIVEVEGQPAAGKKMDQLVSSIIGPEGSSVHITIERSGKRHVLTLSRQSITIPVITTHYFQNGVGYIKLSDFSSDADEKIAAQLQAWNQQGMTALVLDLRENPGGLLDTAANIASLFIPQGVLIHTRDRNGIDQSLEISGGSSFNKKLVVLVNNHSASASEVLTGALQDYKIATVVGTRTYGKGSVQSIFPLQDGGYLKLTVEEYLTPLKRVVNKVGLNPDIVVPDDTAQLLTALHQAGMKRLELRLADHHLTVNGQQFNTTFPSLKSNGHTFIPSRILASLIDGTVSWNNSSKVLTIANGSGTRTFKDSIKNVKGTSYIDLYWFQKSFPAFQWKQDGNSLAISASGGN